MTPVPDVSVVVPTYNRRHTLGESLESLLAQTGIALEIVVVDDGSTDGTAAWLRALGEPRVVVVEGAHAGIAAARNAGIRAARGPLIAFHDSDDIALPGRLALPANHLAERPELDGVIQNGRLLPPEDDPGAVEKAWIAPDVATVLARQSIGVREVFRWNLGQLQGVTVRRRALEAVGPLDESLTVLDDLDLVLRVAVRGRLAFLDVPAFAYRHHAGGVARNRLVVREEVIRVADKLVAEHPEVLDVLGVRTFRRRQARRWSRLAELRGVAGDRDGARRAADRAVALAPGNLRYRLLRRRLDRGHGG